LHVQTAGDQGAITFDALPHPEEVRKALFDLIERARLDERRERASWIADRLAPTFAAGDAVIPLVGVGEPDVVGFDPAPGYKAAAMRRMSAWLPRVRFEAGDGTVTWRKHWWVLVRSTGLVSAALGACLAGWARTLAVGGPVPARAWFVVGAVLAAWLVYRYEDWRNDLYVLTDEHILDVERRPFGLHEDRRQARLSQIQDIRHVVPNPVATLLNYGSVIVETAAATGSFTFDDVYNPARVQEEVFARIERLRTADQKAARERRGDELAEWFRAYHTLAKDAGYAEVNKPLASPTRIG
jgi:hypothetical protein